MVFSSFWKSKIRGTLSASVLSFSLTSFSPTPISFFPLPISFLLYSLFLPSSFFPLPSFSYLLEIEVSSLSFIFSSLSSHFFISLSFLRSLSPLYLLLAIFQIYNDLFEEIIQKDKKYAPVLKKIKQVYTYEIQAHQTVELREYVSFFFFFFSYSLFLSFLY